MMMVVKQLVKYFVLIHFVRSKYVVSTLNGVLAYPFPTGVCTEQNLFAPSVGLSQKFFCANGTEGIYIYNYSTPANCLHADVSESDDHQNNGAFLVTTKAQNMFEILLSWRDSSALQKYWWDCENEHDYGSILVSPTGCELSICIGTGATVPTALEACVPHHNGSRPFKASLDCDSSSIIVQYYTRLNDFQAVTIDACDENNPNIEKDESITWPIQCGELFDVDAGGGLLTPIFGQVTSLPSCTDIPAIGLCSTPSPVPGTTTQKPEIELTTYFPTSAPISHGTKLVYFSSFHIFWVSLFYILIIYYYFE